MTLGKLRVRSEGVGPVSSVTVPPAEGPQEKHESRNYLARKGRESLDSPLLCWEIKRGDACRSGTDATLELEKERRRAPRHKMSDQFDVLRRENEKRGAESASSCNKR